MTNNVSQSQPFASQAQYSTPCSISTKSAECSEKNIRGMLSIFKRTTGKVGADNHHSFGERITIENGKKNLKVSPNDLICFCELKTHTPGDKTIEMELPSSLFEQARQEDMIYFAQDGINYELKLSPHLMWRGLRKEKVSFDDCLNGVKSAFKTSLCEFLYDEDVTDDYYAWAHMGGLDYLLSSEAKQVTLEKNGTSPINFDELTFFTFDQTPRVLFESFKKNKYTIMLSACGLPQIEIFLDKGRLFVHIAPKPIAFPDTRKGWKVATDSIEESHSLFCQALVVKGKEIDESNIIASLNNCGVLTITIPFIDSEQTSNNSNSSITQVNQTNTEVKPVLPKTKILARCDVGLGNKLFVRGEGIPSLNWDKGIEMQCIQGPDLWAVEFDQSDANLKFKFLVNDLTWEKGDNHQIEIGKSEEVIPSF